MKRARIGLMGIVALAFASARALAVDEKDFKVHAEATRVGQQILMKIELVQVDPGGATKSIARPRVLLLEGDRAGIEIGEERAESAASVRATIPTNGEVYPSPRRVVPPAAPATARASEHARSSAAPEIDSGIKVDIISIKGKDKVLVVSTVVEDRHVIWANADTVPIGAAKPADKPAEKPASKPK
jgi:hypothetical protein